MDNLDLPVYNPGPKRRLDPKLIILLLIAAMITIAGIYYAKKTPPPPAQLVSIANNLNFPVYYPTELPAGYTYTDHSAKLQSGLLYFKLHNGTKIISVTQQPIPGSSVNLQNLPSHSSLNVPAGPAAIGISVGNPSIVIATGSTLVNINSSKGVNKDTVIALAKKIQAIKTNSTD